MTDWTLHLGDCLKPGGLDTLPDRSVDVIMADPPYSEHVHKSCRSGLTATNKVHKRGAFSQAKSLGFEHITEEEIRSCAVQYARLARRWVLVFSDVESCHLWRLALEAAGLGYVRTLAWDKYGGAPQFTGDRPAVGFETITLAHPKGRKRWNGGGKRGVYSYSIVLDQRGEQRHHPAQKPLALVQDLVTDFTEPGELVLDSHVGSATTGVACVLLGRRFVGWERDKDHAAVAKARLESARELRVDANREQIGLFR